ncbi:ArgE/DapE family deacylase [Lactobacillus sp. S2-2]|uniref:ArgE/DapE family deacylase n=1 Tax=Lactobacillus sp. S2-2 TaxID=2692917 RepID=UPI001F24D255|nr:ArgE/DapE family deacylase [Lactobacillus sp. S2-2]MCF6515375.1 ArgE/DapE family deacylase [Lactobacillus sp. S2-2]
MNDEQKIEILKDLIKIKSVNGNELAVSQYIKDLLAKYQIEATIDAFNGNRANLIAEIGDSNSQQVIGMTGHQDTVEYSHLKDWDNNPFDPQIVDGKLYGLGAADMKSGLAASVISFIELSQTELKGRVRLLLTAGEELAGEGSYRFKKAQIADLSGMIVCEPTDGNVTYAHSGTLNYQITSVGQAYHSSEPDKGTNAISGLVEYLNQERIMFDDLPVDDILGKLQHSVTVIKGGSQVNIIPDYAEIFGNIRSTEVANNATVIEMIEKVLADINQKSDYQLSFKAIHDFYPVETQRDHPFVQAALQSTKKYYTNHAVEADVTTGGTDASVFVLSNKEMPVIILGPDSEGSSHKINEHTTVNSYLEMINIYQDLITNYLAK